jgi:pyrroloquinoline-quinone synthase
MNFINALHEKLDALHLLKHPFYQAWTAGTLTQAELQDYAREYYHHVAAFPRYISSIHAKCKDIQSRQVLLVNLIEEEQGDENHPELWQRFVEGLGANRVAANDTAHCSKTQELVDGYFDLVNSDYATGLGALYAYERQTPEVAGSKIDGLKKFYNISDERTLKFFEVHKGADVWHSEEVADLIKKLSPEDQEKAAIGAEKGAKLLWAFLDGRMEGKEACLMAA